MSTPRQLPYPLGTKEERYLLDALHSGHLHGDGPFGKRCEAWLEQHHGSAKALLTPSCTAALELACLLALQPGDEVILPSFTFSSSANAIALHGAVPVFVDICDTTLNIDPKAIEAAITPRTRAIMVVHYGGVACAMDEIMAIAARHHLALIEDAAQAILTTYKGKPLGSIGQFGCLSFHQTKNLGCGEGGAILINRHDDIRQACIVREKGTNRLDFVEGRVDKYSWVDIGSSYLPSELQAAMLLAQLEMAQTIMQLRMTKWQTYAQGLKQLADSGALRLTDVPDYAGHNAHIFALRVREVATRPRLMQFLASRGFQTTSHYVPLHSSAAAQKLGRAPRDCPVTTETSQTLVRLPVGPDTNIDKVQQIIDAIIAFYHA